jgi:hypothetical protein
VGARYQRVRAETSKQKTNSANRLFTNIRHFSTNQARDSLSHEVDATAFRRSTDHDSDVLDSTFVRLLVSD